MSDLQKIRSRPGVLARLKDRVQPVLSRYTYNCALPVRTQWALEKIFGESVERVRVRYFPFYVRLHGQRTIATTRRNTIILGIPPAEFADDAELLLHEYFHVLRQWNLGALSRGRYLCELAVRGYCDNRFEVEARQFARAHRAEMQRLLTMNSPSRADSAGPR